MLVLNDQVRIGFVVFKVDIEPGLKLLDQRVFQQEGILFRMHDRKFYVVDPLNQFMGFITGKGFCEVGGYAFADILRLTHIKQLILFVEVFINARFCGQPGCYSAENRTRHGILAYWKTYSIPHTYFTVLVASFPL